MKNYHEIGQNYNNLYLSNLLVINDLEFSTLSQKCTI